VSLIFFATLTPPPHRRSVSLPISPPPLGEVLRALRRVLAVAVADRATSFRAMSDRKGGHVTIALKLDPDVAFRLIDRGPPPTDAKRSQEFRSFWGEKSELRRFKDGAIVEALGGGGGCLKYMS
jgi:hypothetical protein